MKRAFTPVIAIWTMPHSTDGSVVIAVMGDLTVKRLSKRHGNSRHRNNGIAVRLLTRRPSRSGASSPMSFIVCDSQGETPR